MDADRITAIEMARAAGIDEKRLRAALRRAGLSWHGDYERWTVTVGSTEHRQIADVVLALSQDSR